MIYGRVKNGIIQIQRFFQQDLEKAEGKPIEIKILEDSKTLQQTRYLFGIVFKIIAEDKGYTLEEIAYIYKEKYLRYSKEKDGKTYWFTKGISELDKVEMAKFIDQVIMHAQSELGLIIPEPDPEFEYNG